MVKKKILDSAKMSTMTKKMMKNGQIHLKDPALIQKTRMNLKLIKQKRQSQKNKKAMMRKKKLTQNTVANTMKMAAKFGEKKE